MAALLEFKQRLKIFYSKYDIYLIPLGKFLLAMITFSMINGSIGFMQKITSPALSFILALMCSFLPLNLTVVFGAVLVLAHTYALSLEVMLVTGVLILIMFLLFFRVSPEMGYLLLITPLAFVFKVPYVIPIAMGLVAAPIAAVPVSCGVMIYYFLHYIRLNGTLLGNSEGDSAARKVSYLIENAVANKAMLLTIVAFILTLILVYVIRRLSIDYAWNIAIGAGAVANVVILLLGGLILHVSTQVLPVIFGTLGAIVLAAVLEFFCFNVDYSRTEYVQFEDDEYYYYVKAVPKISISVQDKKVKKINSGTRNARRNPEGRSKASRRG